MNTPVGMSPMDVGDAPPTRSVRGRSRTSSSVSQDDVSDAGESIDTTSTPMRFLPYFSLRRFLRGPNHDGNSSADENNNNHDDEEGQIMSEPSTTSNEDDNRSEVPSLSSLEAGDLPRPRRLEPAPEPVAPTPMTTAEERLRYFLNAYPSHFENSTIEEEDDKIQNNSTDEQTDSECASNSSQSSLTSQDISSSLARYPDAYNILDKQSILFPTVSRFRDNQSCTSYFFSVFVGVVVLIALIVFMLVMNLRK